MRSSFGTEPRFLKLPKPTSSWGCLGHPSGLVISGTRKAPLEEDHPVGQLQPKAQSLRFCSELGIKTQAPQAALPSSLNHKLFEGRDFYTAVCLPRTVPGTQEVRHK